MYVVSLQGKDVFQGHDIVCTITRMSHLDKIRVYIKQKQPVRVAEKRHRFKAAEYVLSVLKVVYAVEHTDCGIKSTEHIKLAHILAQILYTVMRLFLSLT